MKQEWGSKRVCPNCGARYYDMHRDPITCPKCGSAFDPEALLKTRRARSVAPIEEEEAAEPMAEAEIDSEIEAEENDGEEDEAAVVEGGEQEEEEEEELIEDASELGEDEDDMAEVIENVEEEDER
jgi:uncharacterized protein (TIGR02300 family)